MESVIDRMPSERDAELAKVARRMIVAALDHSRAQKIALLSDDGTDGPTLELPPMALRFFAEVLGMMAERQPIVLMPSTHELSTQDVANFLNVSRPFVVKMIDEGKIGCRKVGRHRRVEMSEAIRVKSEMQAQSSQALRGLAESSNEFGLDIF